MKKGLDLNVREANAAAAKLYGAVYETLLAARQKAFGAAPPDETL